MSLWLVICFRRESAWQLLQTML